MTENTASNRLPSHRLFQVVGDGDAASWIRIGAAWPNKDGKGFNLACDAVPLSGRIVMRAVQERDEAEGDEQ